VVSARQRRLRWGTTLLRLGSAAPNQISLPLL